MRVATVDDAATVGGMLRDFNDEFETPGPTAAEFATRFRSLLALDDVLVLLEPTCPLRSPEDIGACLRRLAGGGLDSVATFKPAELHPHRAWRIQSEAASPFLSAVDPWQPRQKLPPAFQLNGAVYAFRTDRLPADSAAILFGAMGAVVMPAERSIDIDDALDLLVAEAVLGARS